MCEIKGYTTLFFPSFLTEANSFVPPSSGLCCLLSHSRPDLVDWEALTPGDNAANLTKAFDVAERDLGIARLLDVEGKTVCATHKEWVGG